MMNVINTQKKRNGYVVVLALFLFTSWTGNAQDTRVLFIGNSYTHVNDLPSLVQQMATSVGLSFYSESSTPGGSTFQGHSTNATTLQKIAAGNWDFVVLQEQSQAPSFPLFQVEQNTFPFAAALNDSIEEHNPCAETVFYMTWGRENGDQGNCANWPPVCTYEGMDSLLRERYMMMAEDNQAIVSPAGAVWRYLRTYHPTIQLYSADGSHPSLAGSYAAACAFFTTLFREDPISITFNSSLDAATADIIRNAAKTIVFDQLPLWFIGAYDVTSDFTSVPLSNLDVQFTSLAPYASSFLWNWNDGSAPSVEENPLHTFPEPGSYTVQLTAFSCGDSAVSQQIIEVGSQEIKENLTGDVELYPNPASMECVVNNRSGRNIRRIVVVDGSGKLAADFVQSNTAIPLAALANGTYFVQVWLDDGSVVTKTMVIEK
jgi:hypothetical protein